MAENTELMELQRRLHDSHESSASLRAKIEVLEREMECAWGIIANAGVAIGDWESLPKEWQDCAARWRDRYLGKPMPPTEPSELARDATAAFAAPSGSAFTLPTSFYISPTPEDLALRALGYGFQVEAKQLGISSERLLAMLIRALPNDLAVPTEGGAKEVECK